MSSVALHLKTIIMSSKQSPGRIQWDLSIIVNEIFYPDSEILDLNFGFVAYNYHAKNCTHFS